MAKSIFDKWDESVDVKGLADAVENSTGSGDYKEVPHGKYEVSITKLELVASKKGDPMVSIWFKIVDGEFKNSLIFYNQVITEAFQIHIVNELLRDLNSELNIEFKSYKQYSELLMDVHEIIDKDYEYVLNYTKGKGDFSKYSIDEVLELED